MDLMPPTTSISSTGSDQVFEAMTRWRERRDQGAALQLVRELSPLMHRVALRSLPCAWMAEDAVQTAWMKFFRSLDSFDRRIPVSAWAVVIVKRVCSNMLRTLSRQRFIAFDDVAEAEFEVAVATPLSEDQQDQRELLKQVMKTLSSLSLTDRVIVNCLLLDDIPASEVARRTGLNAGAVRTRACRIRSHLRGAKRRALAMDRHEQGV